MHVHLACLLALPAPLHVTPASIVLPTPLARARSVALVAASSAHATASLVHTVGSGLGRSGSQGPRTKRIFVIEVVHFPCPWQEQW